jgi:hypothetical protein
LRTPFGHSMEQMKAVSCSKQFPHIRQPNNGPFTTFSRDASKRRPNGSRLNGMNGGCQRLPGVNMGI